MSNPESESDPSGKIEASSQDVGGAHLALVVADASRSIDFDARYAPMKRAHAFLRDPDCHNLELSFGQEVGLAVAHGKEHG